MIVFRTVNLTLENMPTHELVSRSGEISLGKVLHSKYKRANSVRNTMGSTFWNFLLTNSYRPTSGFHADLADDGNLFNSWMKSILGGSMKNVHQEIVTHCKITISPIITAACQCARCNCSSLAIPIANPREMRGTNVSKINQQTEIWMKWVHCMIVTDARW